MKPIKHVLIVVEDSPVFQKSAEAIRAGLGDRTCVVKKAADFAAVDLLPADAYFFGCDSARPAAFAELERVLQGINLAGRPCGLFSLASKEAIEYLRGIVRDADLRLHPSPFLASGKADIGSWAAETLRPR